MALVGKDGSDKAKEGKEDSLRLAGLKSLNLQGSLPSSESVGRKFVKVTIRIIREGTAEQEAQSRKFWEAVMAFGLLDASWHPKPGNSNLILSVIDESEAKKLLARDPLIAAGAAEVLTVDAM